MEIQIFIELALVISVDNVLGTREIDYLLKTGKKLGFGREFVRVVIRWASEGIVWKRKMLHLKVLHLEEDNHNQEQENFYYAVVGQQEQLNNFKRS